MDKRLFDGIFHGVSVYFNLCILPFDPSVSHSFFYTHKDLSFVTHTYVTACIHIHAQTLTLASRSYNCPHRDPMRTYHRHRRHTENFIYSFLAVLLFLIQLFFYVPLFPFIGPLSLQPPSTTFLSLSLSLYPSCCVSSWSVFLSQSCTDAGSPETGIVRCSRLPGLGFTSWEGGGGAAHTVELYV